MRLRENETTDTNVFPCIILFLISSLCSLHSLGAPSAHGECMSLDGPQTVINIDINIQSEMMLAWTMQGPHNHKSNQTLDACCVPGTVLSTLHVIFPFNSIFTMTL